MSNQQPPGGRRRRIAGERRRSADLTDAPPGAVEPGPAESEAPPPSGRRSALLRRPSRPAADPVPAGSNDEPADDTRSVHHGWWGSRVSLIVLAAVLVVALLVTGLASLGLLGVDGVKDVREADRTTSSARSASAAAERAAEAILAYDYRSLDEDRDAAARFMTPDYAADYVGTFDTAVKDAATDSKAKVSVEVQGSAVMTAGVDRARILLFLDQTSVSTSFDKPQVALNRVELQMVRQGDTWLVDDVLSF